jgi:hypothetical protein
VRLTPTLPRVHRSWAQFNLTHSTAGGVGSSTGRVVFGSVTITAAEALDPTAPGEVPVFRATPAWVLFFSQVRAAALVRRPIHR